MGKLDGLLRWCQVNTQGFKDVNVTNFHSSWKDGLAFCALIAKFRPDLIDFSTLRAGDAARNLELAFSVADKSLGIPRLLDVEDFLTLPRPDQFSVITYLGVVYQGLESPANARPNGGHAGDTAPPRPAAKQQGQLAQASDANKPVSAVGGGMFTGGTCAKCGKALEGEVVEAAAGMFHARCFGCEGCGRTLLAQFLTVGGHIYCEPCAKKAFVAGMKAKRSSGQPPQQQQQQQETAKQMAEQEAAKLRAEQEVARHKAEEEAAQRHKEAEAARRREQEQAEQRRKEAEAKQKAEAEAQARLRAQKAQTQAQQKPISPPPKTTQAAGAVSAVGYQVPLHPSAEVPAWKQKLAEKKRMTLMMNSQPVAPTPTAVPAPQAQKPLVSPPQQHATSHPSKFASVFGFGSKQQSPSPSASKPLPSPTSPPNEKLSTQAQKQQSSEPPKRPEKPAAAKQNEFNPFASAFANSGDTKHKCVDDNPFAPAFVPQNSMPDAENPFAPPRPENPFAAHSKHQQAAISSVDALSPKRAAPAPPTEEDTSQYKGHRAAPPLPHDESAEFERRFDILKEDGGDILDAGDEEFALPVTTGATVEGYLMRQETSSGCWRRKWFSLTGRRMVFYPDDHRKSTIIRSVPHPEGSIDLIFARDVTPTAQPENSFDLVMEGDRIKLRASSANELQMWAQHIKSAIRLGKEQKEKLEKARKETIKLYQKKEGWLSLLQGQTWKKVWVVMKSGSVFIYSSQGGPMMQTSALYQSELSEYFPEQFPGAFQAKNAESTVVLRASAEEEMHMWLNALVAQRLFVEQTIDSVML